MAIVDLSASRLVNIKERLRVALAKRKYYGNVSALADASKNFTTVPQLGGLVLSEHGQKTIDLILSVTNLGNLKKIENDNYILRDISAIETWLNNYENRDVTSSDSGCRGNCTGLCVSHCSTQCGGSCMNTCVGGCLTSCSGACIETCTGTCVGGCNSSCWSDCASNCTAGDRI